MPWTSPHAWLSCSGHLAQTPCAKWLTHAACRGVLNIVHGTRDVVNWTLDHPDIKAISFVGSDAAGQYIYERGSKSGKRVQVSEGCVATLYAGPSEHSAAESQCLLHVLVGAGSEGSEGQVVPALPVARCCICRYHENG